MIERLGKLLSTPEGLAAADALVYARDRTPAVQLANANRLPVHDVCDAIDVSANAYRAPQLEAVVAKIAERLRDGRPLGGALPNANAIAAVRAPEGVRLSDADHALLVEALDGSRIVWELPNEGARELPCWACIAAADARYAYLRAKERGGQPLSDDEREHLIMLQPGIVQSLRFFGDARDGRVCFVVKEQAVPDAIADAVGARDSFERLRDITDVQRSHDRADAIMRGVAARLPASVFELVVASGVQRPVLTSAYAMSNEGRAVSIFARPFGVGVLMAGALVTLPAWAVPATVIAGAAGIAATFLHGVTRRPTDSNAVRWLEPLRSGKRMPTHGLFALETRHLLVAADASAPQWRIIRSYAHELLHVVDACTKSDGWLSEEPRFRALLRECIEKYEAGDAKAMPSHYARESAQEFFVEAALAFFNAEGAWHQAKAWQLNESAPDLYAYFEELFTTRLPAALADKTFRRL